MTKQKKMSSIESYWQLFNAFCLADNESGTYSELIDRVNFYNQNQKFIKKIPMSATPENSCLLLFAQRLFFGIPKNIPKTQYDYLLFLVSQMQHFSDWLQDSFKFYHLDSTIDSIIAYLKPHLTTRFKQLNPSMSEIEENGMIALGLAGFKGDLYSNCCSIIDSWRKENIENNSYFVKLHCMLNSDFLPTFTEEEIKDKTTDFCIQHVYAKKEKKEYNMEWEGKDIAQMRADVPDLGTLIPCQEESVGKDGTRGAFDSQNLYIEGDNLRALKLLLKPYEGKIKMIYIDPPYNTGHKFCYKDNFRKDIEIFERLFFAPEPKTEEG